MLKANFAVNEFIFSSRHAEKMSDSNSVVTLKKLQGILKDTGPIINGDVSAAFYVPQAGNYTGNEQAFVTSVCKNDAATNSFTLANLENSDSGIPVVKIIATNVFFPNLADVDGNLCFTRARCDKKCNTSTGTRSNDTPYGYCDCTTGTSKHSSPFHSKGVIIGAAVGGSIFLLIILILLFSKKK
jgi:hypothetical protein